LQGAKAEHLRCVGRIGFEPMKTNQRIYSPPHLATLEPAHLNPETPFQKSCPLSGLYFASEFIRSHQRDSNPRPTDYKSVALAN
jgi:hypothetical protein